MNSELSKDAADVVKAGREALRPSAVDKARVFAALEARLPTSLEPVTAGGGGVSGLGAGTKALILATGVAATMAAVAVFSGRDSAPPELSTATPTAALAAAAPTEVEPPAGFGMPAPMVTAARETPAPTSGANGRGNPADRLGEEVALLTRAQREFHAGNLKTALASVDEHRRKFARGRLGLERVKLRVKILCGLGRVSEANAEQLKLGSSKGSADACTPAK